VGNLSKRRARPDRSKINIDEENALKYWMHALAVSKEDLEKAIEKVGSSAAAVRKQLGLSNAHQSGD
jgi:predicted RNA-binding protein YlqC (UPF0109 family)